MSMTNTWARAAAACLVLLCLAGMVVQAQDLKGIGDPTRPPPGAVLSVEEGAASAASSPESAASDAEQGEQEAAKPRAPEWSLQAIRVDVRDGRAVALINDQLVHVGDTVEEMRLVSLSRNVAVLKGRTGTRRLALLPEAEDVNDDKPKTDTARTAQRGRKESK